MNIKNILKKLLYIPMGILFIINLLFLGLIKIYNLFGGLITSINDKIADMGDKLDDIIKGTKPINKPIQKKDEIIELLNKFK
jgi:hypothetical protein